MQRQIREDFIGEFIKLVEMKTGHRHDRRFSAWVKNVTAIDTRYSNGYAFIGDFVSSGTISVRVAPQVFLVCTISGSRRYHTRQFNIVIMDIQGNLYLVPDLQTTDKKKGWALRLMNGIARLISTAKQVDEEITKHNQPILSYCSTLLARETGKPIENDKDGKNVI